MERGADSCERNIGRQNSSKAGVKETPARRGKKSPYQLVELLQERLAALQMRHGLPGVALIAIPVQQLSSSECKQNVMSKRTRAAKYSSRMKT